MCLRLDVGRSCPSFLDLLERLLRLQDLSTGRKKEEETLEEEERSGRKRKRPQAAGRKVGRRSLFIGEGSSQSSITLAPLSVAEKRPDALILGPFSTVRSREDVQKPRRRYLETQVLEMPHNLDNPPAVRIYTICDESKYLIVKNVPALGCGEELFELFGSFGEIVECKPMDAEDCEPFTDVYWIQFSQVSNARFAKRKLDESVFLGNRLQVSYAPDFESLSDTQDKLERRRTEVLSRIKFPRPGGSKQPITSKRREQESWCGEHLSHVSSDQDYFTSSSMNETVRLVRSKLDKVQSSSVHIPSPALKKTGIDNRRRI